MEYRKLISFGKNSFVLTLPKAWVRSNKLKKGDLIYIKENINNLILYPHEQENRENKTMIIDVNKKSIRHIQREIISAYIRNYRQITLVGDEIIDKAKQIQDVVQNLVALEVMEQTSDKIVAKDFLNMEETDAKSLIRKMDIIIRSMISDCKLVFEKDIVDSINFRDRDLNKLSFLLYRTIQFGFEYPGLILKKQKLSPNELLSFWWITYNLEAIGDETKRTARFMKKMEFSKKMQEDFLEIFERIEQNYLNIMNSFYKNNSEMAHLVHEKKRGIIKDCDKFYEQYHDKMWSGYMINHVKTLTTNVHNIGRSIYQY